MNAAVRSARRLKISGRVQGVGFRPFVYRLAHELDVRGWVYNASGDVEIAAEAAPEILARFAARLITDAPPLARPHLTSCESLAPQGFEAFSIRTSRAGDQSNIHVPPDQFACDDCLAEMNDPTRPRYRYPFINCTQCGPRYTIIRAMPYDRPNTSMAHFRLCEQCEREYTDPLDRRFHAQPLACPQCGPELTYEHGDRTLSRTDPILDQCARDLASGHVIALRGIGGYHLVCDATNECVVSNLRDRKHRPSKPLAVMVPCRGIDGLDRVREIASPTPEQARALVDPGRPIVLVRARSDTRLATSIAPGLDEVGIMLPYSPLHHLLLESFDDPIVATSGNISGEPVLTDPTEARSRLASIADTFVHHDRPIHRPADDPVLREIAGAIRPIRLGRGNAPLELDLPFEVPRPMLATGAFLKNTVALAFADRVSISPHIGDLGTKRSRRVFEQVIQDLQTLYGVTAEVVVSDRHPDYPNTRWARDSGLEAVRVWHHHAHASALAGEYGFDRPVLVFTWDGLGLGEDGTAWGGEALYGRPGAWRRVASFRPFKLPGGDRCVYEPWRTATSLAWEAQLSWETPRAGNPLLRKAWRSEMNCPHTSAVGRLFDAAAVFCDVVLETSYDGEAPVRLEAACQSTDLPAVRLPLERDGAGVWRTDWAPLFARLAALGEQGSSPGERAALFHDSMARALVDQALLLRDEYEIGDVGLTGGVFQNRRLAESVSTLLGDAGFNPVIPKRTPVNDGGISFGQIIEAGMR